MKCRDCKFLSEPVKFRPDDYPSVRCTLGLWDLVETVPNVHTIPRWYSWGQSQINRGPIRKFGDICTRGEAK